MKILMPGHEPSGESAAPVMGQMTWHRLATEVMRQSGELLPDEEIAEFKVDDKWIRFRVVPRKGAMWKSI